MTTKESIQTFFDKEFSESNLIIEHVEEKFVRIRRPVTKQDLRPGGTLSGPFMMAVADAAIYAAIFSTLSGSLGLMAFAVTTNLSINFFKKPVANADVVAECKLLKVGKLLVVGEVNLFSDGSDELIAHAVGTYSIPPK